MRVGPQQVLDGRAQFGDEMPNARHGIVDDHIARGEAEVWNGGVQ